MGYETAKMLVDLGAKVYALDIKECDIPNITEFHQCNLSDKKSIDDVFSKLPQEIDCFFGIAGLSGSKTDYITTFNCDFTANKYITLTYLTKRIFNSQNLK